MSSSKPQYSTPRVSKSTAGDFEANEALMMAASGTPAPPRLYDTQWLPSPPESISDFHQDFQDSHCDNHCLHSTGQLEMPVGAGNGDDFGSKLLEYAFSQLHQDQVAFAAKDANQHHNGIQKSTIPSSRKASTKSKISRDKRPPTSSLAATHPSLYRPTPPMSATAMAKLPTPWSTPPNHIKRQDSVVTARSPASTKQHTLLENEVPAWQRFSDPKRLLSDVPKFDDPTPRYLNDDLRPDGPKVISIIPLIGMPLGNIIEAAEIYPKES